MVWSTNFEGMKWIFSSLIFVSLGLGSCTECVCGEFDPDHHLNEWNPFPEAKSAYTFQDSVGSTFTLDQTWYYKEGSDPRFSQGGCRNVCRYGISHRYENVDYKFETSLRYGYNNEQDARGVITFHIIASWARFQLNKDGSLRSEQTDYEVVKHDTLTIAGQEFSSVTEVYKSTPLTYDAINRIYFHENEGFIGVGTSQNGTWLLQN